MKYYLLYGRPLAKFKTNTFRYTGIIYYDLFLVFALLETFCYNTYGLDIFVWQNLPQVIYVFGSLQTWHLVCMVALINEIFR